MALEVSVETLNDSELAVLNDRLSRGAEPPLRAVFMGTPAIAVPLLEAIVDDPRTALMAVVSQPDRPAGRGRRIVAPPVAETARKHGLPLYQPERLREIRADLEAMAPDILVVMAYGRILPRWALDLPALAPLNVHASLLPRHRGASPIQSAILAGDTETGISLMVMTPEMDAGPVLGSWSIPIGEADTAGTIHDAVGALAARCWSEISGNLIAGQLQARAQDDAAATFCRKFTATDRRIDWREPAVAIARRVRAFAPRPGARTLFAGQPLKVLAGQAAHTTSPGEPVPGTVLAVDRDGIDVATGKGVYRIRRLQSAGGRPLDVDAWLRGHNLSPGDRLGE